MKRNMQDIESVFTLCEKAGARKDQESCVLGMVGAYINQHASYEAGENLCEIAPNKYEKACVEGLKRKENFFK